MGQKKMKNTGANKRKTESVARESAVAEKSSGNLLDALTEASELAGSQGGLVEQQSKGEKKGIEGNADAEEVRGSGGGGAADGRDQVASERGGSKNDLDQVVPLERSNMRLLILGGVVLVLVVVGTLTLFWLRISGSELAIVEVEGPILVETSGEEAPVIEPEVEQLARSDIALEILNGSGVPGLAGETADRFEELGYEVVRVGNAQNVSESQLLIRRKDVARASVLLDDVVFELGIAPSEVELEEEDVVARIVLGGKGS